MTENVPSLTVTPWEPEVVQQMLDDPDCLEGREKTCLPKLKEAGRLSVCPLLVIFTYSCVCLSYKNLGDLHVGIFPEGLFLMKDRVDREFAFRILLFANTPSRQSSSPMALPKG